MILGCGLMAMSKADFQFLINLDDVMIMIVASYSCDESKLKFVIC